MEEFEKLAVRALEELKKREPSDFILQISRHTYRLLAEYLEANSIEYSYDAAMTWLSETQSGLSSNYYALKKAAIQRLDTMMRTNTLKFYPVRKVQLQQPLDSEFEQVMAEYYRGKSPETVINMQRQGKHFLGYLQAEFMITSISEIDYGMVISYYDSISSRQDICKPFITIKLEIVRRVLEYCCRHCGFPPGYTMLVDKLSDGKRYVWEDIDAETRSRIVLNQETDADSLDLEQYRAAETAFLLVLDERRYSESGKFPYREILDMLCLFLEMNSYRYTGTTAGIWCSAVQSSLDQLLRNEANRVLTQFEEYLKTGTFDSSAVYHTAPRRMDLLPEWCRLPLCSFLQQKAAENKADSTLHQYRSSSVRFCEYLVSTGLTSFSDLSVETVKNFNRTDSHDTPAGKSAYNGMIRKFLKYLEEEGLLSQDNLYHALPGVCVHEETLISTLSPDEIALVMKHTSPEDDTISLRDKAILLIGLKMGIRPGDILGLKLEDIDWDRETFRFVQQKTRVEVELPAPPEVLDALFRYLMDERPVSKSRNVFISVKAPYAPLACNKGIIRSLQQILPERAGDGSGAQILRRTFATERLRDGAGLEKVAALLGHTGTSATHRYLSLDGERMSRCAMSLDESGIPYRGGSLWSGGTV